MHQLAQEEIDALETKEWLQAIESIIKVDGQTRAEFILEEVLKRASSLGCNVAAGGTTAYQNTLTLSQQVSYPGDLDVDVVDLADHFG